MAKRENKIKRDFSNYHKLGKIVVIVRIEKLFGVRRRELCY